jgi:hypothetical protein
MACGYDIGNACCMLYGLAARESKAKAPGWYGTEVVIVVEKMGMSMSMCEVVGW